MLVLLGKTALIKNIAHLKMPVLYQNCFLLHITNGYKIGEVNIIGIVGDFLGENTSWFDVYKFILLLIRAYVL